MRGRRYKIPGIEIKELVKRRRVVTGPLTAIRDTLATLLVVAALKVIPDRTLTSKCSELHITLYMIEANPFKYWRYWWGGSDKKRRMEDVS